VNILSIILKNFIKIYIYFISPLFGPSCRFEPTCSKYGMQAIDEHGAVKGMFLTVYRILRCNPWSSAGYDPVPPNKNSKITN
tara:strand:- start:618 stop:863 length:246 start_codon:yes stop_codon:yes gene_type:complete